MVVVISYATPPIQVSLPGLIKVDKQQRRLEWRNKQRGAGGPTDGKCGLGARGARRIPEAYILARGAITISYQTYTHINMVLLLVRSQLHIGICQIPKSHPFQDMGSKLEIASSPLVLLAERIRDIAQMETRFP
eukprot:6211834-Pleurochrysis_carterae.AAC.1